MTRKEFIKMREDFLTNYGDRLCDNGMRDVSNSKDAGEFISLLHKWQWNIHDYPTTEWVRKWFANEKELLNANGFYLDQKDKSITNPSQDLVFFGDCDCSVILTMNRLYSVVLYDNAKISLCAYGSSMARIRGKKEQVYMCYKSSTANVKFYDL